MKMHKPTLDKASESYVPTYIVTDVSVKMRKRVHSHVIVFYFPQ